MTLYNPSARLLWSSGNASGWGTALSTTLRSSGIALRDVTDIWLAVVVGAVAGKSPTLDVSLELKDAAGNWFPGAVAVPQVTAAGMGSVSAGMHIASKALLLPEFGRVAAVVGGDGASFTGLSISLFGR